MAAALAEVLEAMRASIASSTGVETSLGKPSRSASGLVLLPYRIRESTEIRNRPSLRDGTRPAEQNLHVVADCLLMPNTPSGYEALGEAISSLHENPIMKVGETDVIVAIDASNSDDLAAICSAAGITLTLAVSLVLRWALGRNSGST